MSKQKGGRSTNMTLADKDLLIDLALKHRSIISNKLRKPMPFRHARRRRASECWLTNFVQNRPASFIATANS